MNRAGQCRRFGAAADVEQKKLVVLADEIERLRADIESLKLYCGVYSSGWRSPYARPENSADEPKDAACRRCHTSHRMCEGLAKAGSLSRCCDHCDHSANSTDAKHGD